MVCHTNTLYSILNGDSAGQIKRMLIRLTSCPTPQCYQNLHFGRYICPTNHYDIYFNHITCLTSFLGISVSKGRPNFQDVVHVTDIVHVTSYLFMLPKGGSI